MTSHMIKVTVTFLEQSAPPPHILNQDFAQSLAPSWPLNAPFPNPQQAPLSDDMKAGLQLCEVPFPDSDFYLFLYHKVGAPWGWYERKSYSDSQLQGLLHDKQNRLFVLYLSGAPAGFFELDLRDPQRGWLAYFGLFPEACGLGLGHWFLDQAIACFWQGVKADRAVDKIGDKTGVRLGVHTCDLDHPAALALYKAHGFTEIRHETIEIPDPHVTASNLKLHYFHK